MFIVSFCFPFHYQLSFWGSRSGQDIQEGVNYASAAAGIRDETGQQLGVRISFTTQVNNYKNTISRIVNIPGDEDSATDYLSKSIYSVGVGSNDYLNNYFMPLHYSSSRQFTPEQYAQTYAFGARKLALIGVGQIGFRPNALAQNSPNGKTCVRRINSANQIFNNKVKGLVNEFNNYYSDAKFIYIDAYGIFWDLINNPSLLVLGWQMLGDVVLEETMDK
ncbi:hypothetical protein ACH5RR_018267 [Cinchona calisaya]|uniref:GDSL esterase/lipase n=1 Tax=Cinchona calisaya TaxID=153742 RepID=A0ABD2ZM94_9GENT